MRAWHMDFCNLEELDCQGLKQVFVMIRQWYSIFQEENVWDHDQLCERQGVQRFQIPPPDSTNAPDLLSNPSSIPRQEFKEFFAALTNPRHAKDIQWVDVEHELFSSKLAVHTPYDIGRHYFDD